MTQPPKIESEWQAIQDNLVRHVLGHMGFRRMTDGDLCESSGVSKSIWDNAKNLRYPMKIEQMVAVTMAVGLRIKGFDLVKVHTQHRSRAFTLWI